jgi:tRNA(Ile)-lysidine synthase
MMLADFLQFIRKQGLCTVKDRILVAVSGGIDSMVLLDLFVEAGYEIGIAHCNFGLRGKESDDDESFVKKKAQHLGVPFFVERFRTDKFSKDHGISVQMAARELRYEWFGKILQENQYDFIATAHHLNDHIETSLFNLFKGTGLQGLTGIPVRHNQLIRPLLFASKAMIMDYAGKKNMSFREDRSNVELKYRRNLIRNKIIPLIEEINPGFISTMTTTLERLNDTQRLISYWLERHRNDFMKRKGEHIYLESAFFQRINSPVFLHEVLKAWGFHYDQCRDILKKRAGRTGALYFSESHALNVDREFLIISPRMMGHDAPYEWPEDIAEIETKFGLFKKETVIKADVQSMTDPNAEFFDLTSLKFPLFVRSWGEGDRFMPLGMKGKKKLSDFMIDEKIPVNLKQRLPVLLSGGAIIWVVGYRIDDRFKIIPESNQILKITFEPFYDQPV